MLSAESPFPCHWWGTSLENVGLDDVRPNVGTYGQYKFDQLPSLPFEMRGDFAWLDSAPTRGDNIGVEKSSENAKALALLRKSSHHLGLRLPEAFIQFMETPALQKRIRSNTDCFLDLCAEPVRSPIGNGYLVRFLADSQGCIFWYLFLTSDGADHAIVASTGFYGTEAEQWDDEPPEPSEIVFCAESFEEFMCRFWLENEIWFAAWKKTPMPEGGRGYIERYRRKEA